MFDKNCEICDLLLMSNNKDIEEYETVHHTTSERDGYTLYYCLKCYRSLNKNIIQKLISYFK